MTTVKKIRPVEDQANEELVGTLGMTAGGVAGGLAAGAAAGAAFGSVAGPVGVVAGAAIGGALGGAAAQRSAENYNVVEEEAYWQETYPSRPYASKDHDFEAYRPAYRLGMDAYSKNPDGSFENLEPSLRNNWNIDRGTSQLEWNEAREAARDAFERVQTRKPSSK